MLRNLVVREGRRTGQLQTRLVTSPACFPRPPVDLHTVIEGPSGGTDGPTGVLGAERLERGGLRAATSRSPTAPSSRPTPRWPSASTPSPPSSPGLEGSERVFDLYCGIGTIGLTLARRAGEVWGLEIVPEAIADAERNARRERDRERPLRRRRRPHRRAPAARARPAGPTSSSIDPPRAGLSQKIVRRVIECEAQRIVYVSCNPTTLAPNAAQLARPDIGCAA